MTNYKFIQDLFREKSGGKYSSKKIWGHIIMASVLTSFTLDGLHFYTANENLFNSMLIAGTTLIGLRTIKSILSRKNEES